MRGVTEESIPKEAGLEDVTEKELKKPLSKTRRKAFLKKFSLGKGK